MDRISVIVPVYKVESYLPSCIESVLSQTYPCFELILVDDGSPDHCGEICDAYARKDDRVRVIHQKNAGLSAARNAGLEIASGTYVTFVDSDDAIHPQMLERLIKAIQTTDANMSLCFFTRAEADLAVQVESKMLEMISGEEPGIVRIACFSIDSSLGLIMALRHILRYCLDANHQKGDAAWNQRKTSAQ